MHEIKLVLSKYKLFEYEKDLATREINTLLNPTSTVPIIDGFFVQTKIENPKVLISNAKKLTYFESFIFNKKIYSTNQNNFQNSCIKSKSKRQATRYGGHGLHDYKGKFNPQIVSVLINIFKLKKGDKILDPFCGSGTTLLESSYSGIDASGFDINPLATLITNTKLNLQNFRLIEVEKFLSNLQKNFNQYDLSASSFSNPERSTYLKNWFKECFFNDFEVLRSIIISEVSDPNIKNFLLCCASNILREYSLQEPLDLRIRRRKSEYPSEKIIDKFISECIAVTKNIERLKILNKNKSNCRALNLDIRKYNSLITHSNFSAVITSPPYATALPYIDTQRLSLVWLDLIKPKQIKTLDSELIGSREITKREQISFIEKLKEENLDLPEELKHLCKKMFMSLDENDGFRRKAVPSLMYRYYCDMSLMFKNVYKLVKPHSPFALLVGKNETTLGGKKYNLDTPQYLTLIAQNNGWFLEEKINLQTYQRYGLHSKNSVREESLIILRKV